MLTDCGPLKFRIDRCNILLHVIEFCIENKERLKILFKQRSQQLIEMLILGGKTTIVRRTLQSAVQSLVIFHLCALFKSSFCGAHTDHAITIYVN